MPQRILASLLLIGLAATVCGAPVSAAPVSAAPWPPAEEARLAALCAASARQPPSALALAVAAEAGVEHQAFGGHVIDRDGRMRRFGAVEADAHREDVPGRGVPWRQVMRYWETLGPLGEGPLQVRRHPGLGGDAAATAPAELLPLQRLLEGAGPGLPSAEREAVAQALMRAAAVDIPWSAAFVSHVALTAGVARSRFTASMAHIDYVAEAARRSAEEAAGRPSDRFYRACDPRRTAARPGDLLCLHRHAPADLPPPEGRQGLFAQLVPALAAGERPVWTLHCDVVVGRDDRRRTVTLIGGNVLQSVTRRDLATDRRGALALPRRPAACEDGRAPGPLCQPEAAPWFVLLQAVDAE